MRYLKIGVLVDAVPKRILKNRFAWLMALYLMIIFAEDETYSAQLNIGSRYQNAVITGVDSIIALRDLLLEAHPVIAEATEHITQRESYQRGYEAGAREMKKITKRFVTFYSPGSFVSNESTQEVDVDTKPSEIEWPDNAFAFVIHEREDIVNGDKVYRGDAKRVGPKYFHPLSKVESLDEVRANPDSGRILITNMENNNYSHVVWSRFGNSPEPFSHDKDCIL